MKSNRHGFVASDSYSDLAMREYRSEFSPEHGVWVLKRVDCEARDDAETVRLIPSAPQRPRLRVVESKSAVGN